MLAPYIRRSGGASYPTAPISGASQIYEADSGVGVTVGNPVTTWRDGSGNGFDLLVPPLGGGPPTPTAPTLKLDGDQLPYVMFDGVANILGLTTLPVYVGTDLTAYWCLRHFFVGVGVGEKAASCLTRSGVIAGVGAGTYKLSRNPGETMLQSIRNNNHWSAQAAPNDPNSGFYGTWSVYAMRTAVVSGNIAMWTMCHDGIWGSAQFGAPGTAPDPWNVSRFSIGGTIDIGAGFSNDFLRCDFRAAAVYRVAHSDEDMKKMLRYLAHKWKVPVLD